MHARLRTTARQDAAFNERRTTPAAVRPAVDRRTADLNQRSSRLHKRCSPMRLAEERAAAPGNSDRCPINDTSSHSVTTGGTTCSTANRGPTSDPRCASTGCMYPRSSDASAIRAPRAEYRIAVDPNVTLRGTTRARPAGSRRRVSASTPALRASRRTRSHPDVRRIRCSTTDLKSGASTASSSSTIPNDAPEWTKARRARR
jgi:hypothetical protein